MADLSWSPEQFLTSDAGRGVCRSEETRELRMASDFMGCKQVPGLPRWAFFTPSIGDAPLWAAFVARCFLAASPLVNLWAVCSIPTMVWTPLYLPPSPSVRARGERGHRHQRVEKVVNTIQSFCCCWRFIYLFILFYVFEYFACVYVCTLSMCLVSTVARRGHWIYGQLGATKWCGPNLWDVIGSWGLRSNQWMNPLVDS